MEAMKSAIRIFKLLILSGEINRKEHFDLYSEYIDGNVQEILSIFEEEFECKFLNFDDTIYLVPKLDGFILGNKPAEFRQYFGSNATQRDVYLGFYIIMYIFYEFYSGANRDPKKVDFIQISHLISALDERFERLEVLNEVEIDELEEKYMINIQSSIKLWSALFTDHESKRKTKYKIIRNACKILEEQKLAYVVEEQIRTTPKLDALMRQYYLHADRLNSIRSAFEKGEL
jgi:hypothetical protein